MSCSYPHKQKFPQGISSDTDGTIRIFLFYPFWQKQAVLEVELPSEDTELVLPPYLTVLCDVSGDRRYKNVSLARAIPDENE